jgi:hypothetical protein
MGSETSETTRIDGQCSCGVPVTLIKGSRRSFRTNGDQYAYTSEGGDAYSIFRCRGCGEPIDETFVERTKATGREAGNG